MITSGGKVAHVVEIPSNEEYCKLKGSLPPTARFTNVEEWGFNHFWLYSPNGDIIIFTPDPIVKLAPHRLIGDFK